MRITEKDWPPRYICPYGELVIFVVAAALLVMVVVAKALLFELIASENITV